jgi:phage/plasmid-associated DNA primase
MNDRPLFQDAIFSDSNQPPLNGAAQPQKQRGKGTLTVTELYMGIEWHCAAGRAPFPLAFGKKVPMRGTSGFCDAKTDLAETLVLFIAAAVFNRTMKSEWRRHSKVPAVEAQVKEAFAATWQQLRAQHLDTFRSLSDSAARRAHFAACMAGFGISNVAVATGQASNGFCVYDVDWKKPDKDGRIAHAENEKAHGKMDEQHKIDTASGFGCHYPRMVRGPSRGGSDMFGKGVDFKGDGGYAAVWPTIVDGKQYAQFPNDIPDAEPWIVAKVTRHERTHTKASRSAAGIAGVDNRDLSAGVGVRYAIHNTQANKDWFRNIVIARVAQSGSLGYNEWFTNVLGEALSFGWPVDETEAFAQEVSDLDPKGKSGMESPFESKWPDAVARHEDDSDQKHTWASGKSLRATAWEKGWRGPFNPPDLPDDVPVRLPGDAYRANGEDVSDGLTITDDERMDQLDYLDDAALARWYRFNTETALRLKREYGYDLPVQDAPEPTINAGNGGGGNGGKEDSGGGGDDDDLSTSKARNERRLAYLFASLYLNHLYVVRDEGKDSYTAYLYTPETHWRVAGKQVLRHLLGCMLEGMRTHAVKEAAAAPVKEDYDRLVEEAAYYSKAQNKKALDSVIGLLGDDNRLLMPMRADGSGRRRFNEDTTLIAVKNFLIDPVNKRVLPADPTQMRLGCYPYTFTGFTNKPTMPTKFAAFLAAFLARSTPAGPQHDKTLINWYCRWMAYCLTHSTHLKLMTFVVGPTNSAKSVMHSIRKYLHGGRTTGADCPLYAQLPPSVITSNKNNDGSGPRNDEILARDKTLGIVDEVKGKIIVDGTAVKAWTSGVDTVSRGNYEGFQPTAPTVKIEVMLNEMPEFDIDDEAAYERLAIVRVEQTFPVGTQEERLNEIRTELNDLFCYLINVLAASMQPLRNSEGKVLTGLGALADYLIRQKPECVQVEKTKLKADNNPFATFVEEHIEFGTYVERSDAKNKDEHERFELKRDTLLTALRDWAEKNNIPKLADEISVKNVTKKLRTLNATVGTYQPNSGDDRVRRLTGVRMRVAKFDSHLRHNDSDA